jgi:hypothetical protein
MNAMNSLKGMTGVRLSALGALAATVAFAVSAGAGASYKWEVWFSGNQAGGGVSAARRSADGNQSIGCYLYAGQAYGGCAAFDRNSAYKGCYTYNASHLQAITGINATSYVAFSVNADGSCGYIQIQGDSRFVP